MGPNFTGMQKVLDRIDEIARRCNPQAELLNSAAKSGGSVQSRFVELLDAENKRKENNNENNTEASLGAGNVGKAGKAGKNKAATPVDDLRLQVSRIAGDYNIDEELIRAVIQVESGWKPDAVSSKGAMGLMQLMPPTAKMLGVDDAFNPEQNIEGGVKYLAQLTDKYDGDVEMALAAYNAGPGRVDAAGGIPFPVTERYVRNVMALYHRYREEPGA